MSKLALGWPHATLLFLLLGCTGGGPNLDPTYENIEGVVRVSCGASSRSCHGGTQGSARLNFGALIEAGMPITEALVGVPSCEYDAMDRVSPGNPDDSWLMIKLAHDFDADGVLLFEPDPAWDPGLTPNPDGSLPASVCPRVERGSLSFGTVMPQTIANPMPLSDGQIEMFREWIALGAPGPE